MVPRRALACTATIALMARGAALAARSEITSKANHHDQTLDADLEGHIVAKRLPFGFYTVNVTHAGFAPATKQINVQSAIPPGTQNRPWARAGSDFAYHEHRRGAD